MPLALKVSLAYSYGNDLNKTNINDVKVNIAEIIQNDNKIFFKSYLLNK